MKNEIVQTQPSEPKLAKTKKLMGVTHKILNNRTKIAVKKEAKALVQPLITGRYRDEGNGTVTDITTNLQWQRFHVGQRWENKSVVGESDRMNFDQGAEAAQQCNYSGYTDWRVPTIGEIQSLVYSSTGFPKTWNDTGGGCEGYYQKPTLCLEAFPWSDLDDQEDKYWDSIVWSSSPLADDSGSAWGVYFSGGGTGSYDRSNSIYVRLVRSGQ